MRLIPVQIVGFQSAFVLSSSEYDDRSVTVCSLTLPRTVVFPHVIALGARELMRFSTGLGRLRLGGFGGDEEVIENGLEKLAKLDAMPEFERRKLRRLSGDVDRLCEC